MPRPDALFATTADGNTWLIRVGRRCRGWGRRFSGARARILVRGPQARCARRAGGLTDHGMSTEETTGSLVDQVIAGGADRRIVAVQLRRAVLVGEHPLNRNELSGCSKRCGPVTSAPAGENGRHRPRGGAGASVITQMEVRPRKTCDVSLSWVGITTRSGDREQVCQRNTDLTMDA